MKEITYDYVDRETMLMREIDTKTGKINYYMNNQKVSYSEYDRIYSSIVNSYEMLMGEDPLFSNMLMC